MTYQILNGDSLAHSFPDTKIKGAVIVVREGLIDGDLLGNDLQAFREARAKSLGLSMQDYYEQVASEFEKIMAAPADSEFNLWFEYDLFCQVNLWFVISLINNQPVNKKVYVVHTSHLDKTHQHFWNGFGPAHSPELEVCYKNRVLLTNTDLAFGQDLWNAYKQGNLDALLQLSKNQSPAFPYVGEVIQAHVDRFPKDGQKGRPEKVLEDIIKNVSTEFPTVFKEFWSRESIYGFGDTQLKHLYDQVMRNH